MPALAAAVLCSAAFALLPASAAHASSTCTVNNTPVTGTTITGSPGFDTIACLAGVDADTTINGLGGADTITVVGGNAGTINGDDGFDNINVSGGNTGLVNGGRNFDTITVTGGNSGIVDGGSGIDLCFVALPTGTVINCP